jgi:actin, other eukaryote
MESVWRHTFHNELRVAPENQAIIMSEELGNPNENRKKTIQIMFETFSVPAFYLEQTSLLSLYSSGRTTGTVLNMGHTKNDVCCIYDGNILPKGEISYLAGRELNNHLQTLLQDAGIDLGNNEQTRKEIVTDIKEKICNVKFSDKFPDSNEYELPDGSMIKIFDRTSTTELLFDKYKTGEELTLQEMISKCIISKDEELFADLFGNIVLSGGGSMFYKLSDRLKFELEPFYSKKIKVVAPPERKYSQWIGASILSSLSTFQKFWIGKEKYEEFGPNIVNYICFNNVGVNHVVRVPNQVSVNLSKMKNKFKFTDLYFHWTL